MNSTAYLVTAAAVMITVVSTVQMVPRLTHAPNKPDWLTNTAAVFGLVFVIAALMALSIANLAGALMIHIPHATAALAIACALHMLTWSAVRKLNPNRVRFVRPRRGIRPNDTAGTQA
jgi:hypothetical protein